MTQTLTPTAPTTLDPGRRRVALIAGASYLLMALLALFANFVVIEGLTGSVDASEAFSNIADSSGLFRLGIVAFLAIFILDVVVAWALYVLFREVAPQLSLATAWFRLVYTVMLGAALVFLTIAVQLTSGSATMAAFEQGQLEAHVQLALDAFHFAWHIGLVAFGFHLILIGYLIKASSVAPKVLAWILIAAGSAYILDPTAQIALSTYSDYANVFLAIVAVPSIVGEIWFTFWLLARAGREPQPAA